VSLTPSPIQREQWRLLLAAVPVLLVAWFVLGAIGSFSERPLVVAVVLLPLLIVVVVLARPIVRDRRLILGGGFLPFFVAYCLLFAIAAGTRLLEGQRAIVTGFEDQAPSNVLGLNRLGDWHYLVARPAPPMNDIVIVTLPSFVGSTREEARLTQAGLIARAVDRQARGIAFDYVLEENSLVDRILCARIRTAEEAGVPVVYGYRGQDSTGRPVRQPLPAELAGCLSAGRLGTLMGLLEADGYVRMLPTSHLADTTLRSFSWRIATLLAGGDQNLPRVGLVQFMAPRSMPVVFDTVPDDVQSEYFRDRFVIVGSHRPEDVRATPFDSMTGVTTQALAAHGLRTGHIIRRVDARWLLPAILVLCWVLTLLQARGGGLRHMLPGAAVLSAAVIASGVLAMSAGLVWIDLSYPLIAVWGMTGVLAGGAQFQRGRTRISSTPPLKARPAGEPVPAAADPFDVFLSHNSNDKPAVIDLGEALQGRGVRVWLDQWELVPGRPWQEAIEDVIETARSAAVLIGRDGIGPWEEPEMRACLDQCVKRRMPVIPVLLPGAPSQPKLPLFLAQITWVDLRDGLTEKGLDKLQWGITGIKPGR
jgi:CHASE2 domain-containing sensor protein